MLNNNYNLGGYDEGYRFSPCFWGTEPARLVRELVEHTSDVEAMTVLDVGCGEGKNSYFLASMGMQVIALDISPFAIRNAKSLWPPLANLSWNVGDIRKFDLTGKCFDIVIATGILHCLRNLGEINSTINRIKSITKSSGYNILSTFNNRSHDLSGHEPSFSPCLLPHMFYVSKYAGWQIKFSSDEDLEDIHPHTDKIHFHSITRIMAHKL